MKPRFSTIFFDLDGTLTDSGEGILKSAQYALEHFGIHVEDLDSLRFFVGPPLEDAFRKHYGFSDEEASRAVALFRERYVPIGVHEQHLYEGVKEFLAALRAAGCLMAITTSKPLHLAMTVAEEFGIKEYFDGIFGRDAAGTLHSKADVIRHAVAELGAADLSGALLIGDRMFDVRGAKECGLASMGVLHGYGSRAELEEAGADFICEDFRQMLEVILGGNS